MNTFPVSNDEYSVEEISYDDMMSILESQDQSSLDKSDTHSLNKAVLKHDDFSQRIAENAKQQLPDWLLTN